MWTTRSGNLTVFRASMRRIAEIHTARSGAEALERLAQEEFSSQTCLIRQRRSEAEPSRHVSRLRRR
ncbi:MAG: hypothetical protein ACI8S6_004991 [Myxococcota bacterium]|jgi:hypothetical protein